MNGEDDNQSLLDALAEVPQELSASDGPAPETGEEAIPEDSLDPLPGEGTDPALSVDGMLSSAIFSDPLEAIAPAEELSAVSPEILSLPSFQLQIKAPKKIWPDLEREAKAQLLELKESSPTLSHLSEYQALLFRQTALRLGAEVELFVNFPIPELSEDERALGDLAMVPEVGSVLTEGAGSVALAKNEKEVILLAEPTAGLRLVESLGIVTAHRSIARRLFQEDEAHQKLLKELSLLPMAGSRDKMKTLHSSRLEELFHEIFFDLQKSALSKGGNAVLGLRLEAFPETQSLDRELEQLRLIAFGTAAVVEKAEF